MGHVPVDGNVAFRDLLLVTECTLVNVQKREQIRGGRLTTLVAHSRDGERGIQEKPEAPYFSREEALSPLFLGFRMRGLLVHNDTDPTVTFNDSLLDGGEILHPLFPQLPP